jgi:hypothetical protein
MANAKRAKSTEKPTTTKAEETAAGDAGELVLLTGDDVLDADDLTTTNVYVGDWGGHVPIKLMDANAAENWGRQAADKKATAVSTAIALVRACAINPDGSKMFPTKESIKRLAEKSMRGIRIVSDACIKFNGLGDGRRRELAEMLRTRAEDEELAAGVVAVLMELAEELDGETVEAAAKNG